MKKLLIIGLVFVLFLAGCASATSMTTPTEVASVSMPAKTTATTELATSEKVEIISELIAEPAFIETPEKVLVSQYIMPIAKNNDWTKAYAKALFDGCHVPSEEARKLMDKNEELIENEPRLVVDDAEQLHIIWTNDAMYLVVDGEETTIKVSECIFSEVLPELPTLESLAEYHAKNEFARYAIAETVYLEELSEKMEAKSLYRVRFYNYNGKVVAVYSLEPDGELYIDTEKAENFYQ